MATSPKTASQKVIIPHKTDKQGKSTKKAYSSVPATGQGIAKTSFAEPVDKYKQLLYRLETDQASHDHSDSSSIHGGVELFQEQNPG